MNFVDPDRVVPNDVMRANNSQDPKGNLERVAARIVAVGQRLNFAADRRDLHDKLSVAATIHNMENNPAICEALALMKSWGLPQ